VFHSSIEFGDRLLFKGIDRKLSSQCLTVNGKYQGSKILVELIQLTKFSKPRFVERKVISSWDVIPHVGPCELDNSFFCRLAQ
jgi:hypothetical protein